MLASLCKAGIRLYWKFVPEDKRIVCLYKDNCSKHVYNSFDQEGFLFGVRSFLYRYRNCNNDYSCRYKDGEIIIETSAGETIREEDISDLVLRGCRAMLEK